MLCILDLIGKSPTWFYLWLTITCYMQDMYIFALVPVNKCFNFMVFSKIKGKKNVLMDNHQVE